MNLKKFNKMISDALSEKRIDKYKQISKSYISIFLVLLLLLTTTFAWFTVTNTAQIDSDTFTMESTAGLRVNDGEQLKNHIIINNMVLSEASSVDGRNMFFPTTGTFEGDTSEMVFREGNVGDKNSGDRDSDDKNASYCYKDFTLKGDSGVTNVYVKNYSVKVNRLDSSGNTVQEVFDGSTKIEYDSDGIPIAQEEHAECPIRMALIDDSSNTPTVIDPSALINNYANKYYAVDSIDSDGKATTKLSEADSFSDYYYGTGKPIFTLVNSQPISVSLVVWLEGTSDASNQYVGQSISVDIQLESNWTDMDYVTFVDDTEPDSGNPNDPYHWVNLNGDSVLIMTYKDVNAENAMKSVVMKQSYGSTTEWYAPIPKNVITDISFYRYNTNREEIYNAWHTYIGVNSQLSDPAKSWVGSNSLQEYRTSDGTSTGTVEHIYTAKHGNGYGTTDVQKERLSPCVGYWGNAGSSTETTAATSATTATSATGSGGSSGNTVTIQISIGQLKSWVQGNLENANDKYDLYAEFSDGTLIKMNKVSSDYYQNNSATVKLNTTLKSFTLKSASDTKYLLVSPPELIVENKNLSFEMQNDDTVKRTG